MSGCNIDFDYSIGEMVPLGGAQMKVIGLCHTRNGNMVMLENNDQIIIRTEAYLRGVQDEMCREGT